MHKAVLLFNHYNLLSQIWGPSSPTSFFLHFSGFLYFDFAALIEFNRVWVLQGCMVFSCLSDIQCDCRLLDLMLAVVPWWRKQDKGSWGFWHLIGLQPDHLVFPLMVNTESPLIEFGHTKKLLRFEGRSWRLDLTLKVYVLLTYQNSLVFLCPSWYDGSLQLCPIRRQCWLFSFCTVVGW